MYFLKNKFLVYNKQVINAMIIVINTTKLHGMTDMNTFQPTLRCFIFTIWHKKFNVHVTVTLTFNKCSKINVEFATGHNSPKYYIILCNQQLLPWFIYNPWRTLLETRMKIAGILQWPLKFINSDWIAIQMKVTRLTFILRHPKRNFVKVGQVLVRQYLVCTKR